MTKPENPPAFPLSDQYTPEGLRALQHICSGPRGSFFRDIEYRAMRDILLARLWQCQVTRNNEAA